MVDSNLNIEQFNKWKVFDQIFYLDNFYQNILIEKEISSDIENLLLTSIKKSNNLYVQRSAIKILCELTLVKKYSKRFNTIGLIIDLMKSDESTLQSIALKYLSFFPDAFTNTTLNIIKELSDSSNGEVSSQAYLCLGLFQFSSGITDCNDLSLMRNISKARPYFQASIDSIENRIDAEYYLLIIDWVEAVLADDSKQTQTNFNLLQKCLLVRGLYEIELSNLELDYLIFELLQKIKDSYDISRTSNEWFDFPSNLQTLYDISLEIHKIHNLQHIGVQLLNAIFADTFQKIQDSIYKIHLTSERIRIQSFKNQSENSRLVNFIESLLEIVTDVEQGRAENHQHLAIFSAHLGYEEGLKLYKRTVNKDITFEEAIVELLQKSKTNEPPFKTGSIIGQEIMFFLKSELEQVIPNYPKEKWDVFFNIVEEIIKYARSTFVGHDKKRFLFLYSISENGKGEKAIEQDLQDSMFTYLEHSKIADGLDYEKAKFVDGGRVDIVYKKDLITVPIELKKSTKRPDKKTLEQNYIAQAQTYTAGYDQLGIFVLLDLSDKSKEPPPNFKDWFKIHHLSPSTNLNVDYPDYIISVVIPGNRTTPSAKSVYKY